MSKHKLEFHLRSYDWSKRPYALAYHGKQRNLIEYEIKPVGMIGYDASIEHYNVYKSYKTWVHYWTDLDDPHSYTTKTICEDNLLACMQACQEHFDELRG